MRRYCNLFNENAGAKLNALALPRVAQMPLVEPTKSLKQDNREVISRMTPFTSLQTRFMKTVAIAVAAAIVTAYLLDWGIWTGLAVGAIALAATWIAQALFLRQLRRMTETTRQLASGDLTARVSVEKCGPELADLATSFNKLAEKLQERAQMHQETERMLQSRALQQAAVAALGQFALVSQDFHALLNQAVTLVTQTLDVEYCEILELQPDGKKMLLRAGVGWKRGHVGVATVDTDRFAQPGFTLTTGEPVIVQDLRSERRFKASPMLWEHGVVSGVTVAIATRHGPYGVLGAHTAKRRQFTSEEVQFLLAVATALALAVERSHNAVELQKLAQFTQLNPNPAMELAEDGTITYFNDAALKLAMSVNERHPRAVLPADIVRLVRTCLAEGRSLGPLETRVQGRTFSWAIHPLPTGRAVHCYGEDITNRLSLEGQLRQSQKMESIGQLAAGVAHDFNNMLTIIQGHAGILMAKPNLPPELFDSAQATYFAAERAAGLTRQLLMFSRKNVMQPKPLDLREVVSTMSKLLHRLLGETVILEFNPPAEIPVVHADDGMIEQVIMNLAVNARDAMLRGGKLTISIDSIRIGEDYVQTNSEARPGNYVCLRVADTGCGMDSYTVTRIFEPFFTTKEVGKGTGLGLATVYGIVKQHEGWIEVSSELGKGTTFSVFLPAGEQMAVSARKDTNHTAAIPQGTEGILIVEDEPVIRDMAHMILEECGYQIFEAGSGREALDVWARHKDNIHLLLTDMVMPEGVSGVELAEKLLASRAGLKVVFASGYTVDDISTDFLSKNNNARFLQKPYTRISLANTIREALDGAKSEAAATAR